MKIGEALVKAGLIKEDQLTVALERQNVFGGRIDTNIVELRFIDDARLAHFLGRFLNLPSVIPEMVNDIPEELINTLSKEKVEIYKVLPFRRDGNRLHIAMLNPKDIQAIEELRFITGFEIIPYVITELRLLNAFEKYYGIKKEIRYISLKDRFNPNTEQEEITIERSDSKFTNNTQRKNQHIFKTNNVLPETMEKVEIEGLIGALLTNAFFTAKLFYTQQGLTLTDSEVEYEVLRRMQGFGRKSLDSLTKKI